MKYMSVRAAADALGVHENTIRRWESQGILSAVRLPGSNFRRFDPDQIQRVARDMARGVERGHTSDVVPSDTKVVSGTLDESLWDS